MQKALKSNTSNLLLAIKSAFKSYKTKHAYELIDISPCTSSNKHKIDVKITGKSQSLTFYAEEIAADNNFLFGFSPIDIRTIVYLATCDKYEAIFEEEKLKKSLEVIRSKNIEGSKSVQLKDKNTGTVFIKKLKDFNDINIIEKLSSHDAYKLGFLAGQEQTFLSSLRLKLVKKDDENQSQ